jgi:hypothetical protein
LPIGSPGGGIADFLQEVEVAEGVTRLVDGWSRRRVGTRAAA